MAAPELNLTFGCAFIGLIAGAILYGVTLLQTFLYYRTYPQDSRFIKSLVFVLWILDTAHLVLCTVSLYWYLVINFNNPDALGRTSWSMELQTDCNGLIGLIVECFFARRVWMMSENAWLTGVIVILSCVHFGLGIVFTVEGFVLKETAKFGRLIWVTSAGLGSAAAADIIIACALCYYLTKNRTGFSRTDSLISTLIAYSLTTGLITSVIAFVAVVTFAIMPTNFVWLAFFWILGKCYVNSILAALNSRDFLRGKVAPPHQDCTLHLSPFRAMTSNADVAVTEADCCSGRPGPSAVSIHIQTKTEYDYDTPPVSASKTTSFEQRPFV
ncbi:hypothetical protein LshimejAT787_0503080 [Lyophyllum shimeji]|uniref:DUF6534 domain-containing protein n=1 Tax=Lyophyllum shimeji TaxID=47721 RepID=A0A9P3PM46_LYOSH|nr:hypothetical protein LshimejAT787_0503080 [Lyophyllum shimeji]